MAEKLLKYYKYIGENSGLVGQMKLAQMTLTPSAKAAMTPDSPDIVEKFKKAVEEITRKPAPSF